MSNKYQKMVENLQNSSDPINDLQSSKNCNISNTITEDGIINYIDNLLLKNSNVNLEKFESYNKESCYDDSTKFIIVGTITPYCGKGYFYSSPNNKVYSILDEIFDTNLCDYKKKLNDPNLVDKTSIIKGIRQILKDKKVSFIDVAKEVIRKKNDSKDSSILLMSLDYETFKNVENKAHIVRYICTSNNAKICLNKILEKNNVSNQNVCVCYQDRFHYNKNDWKNALK